MIKALTSKIKKFRKKYQKEGYELVDITSLCEVAIGTSGWCNELNIDEPEEKIYHVRISYREEIIASVGSEGIELISDDNYVIFEEDENDFVVFRLVPLSWQVLKGV
jgi:hypothetical protein|tara:strand:- start:4872 stop:5192 length:321 start_codon:yes stop_codon:yes gene_type:complete